MASRVILCPICGEDNFHKLFEVRGNRGVAFIDPIHQVVLCQNCGFCFLNPQHTAEDYQAYYKSFDRPATGPGAKKRLKREVYDPVRLEFLKQAFPNRQGRVLDIGSGYGLFLSGLKEGGYQNLFGLEPNQEAVRFSRANFGFQIEQGSLEADNLPTENFDAAVLIAVMEHLVDPIGALKKIYRLLKPGGVLYVNTLNLRDVVLRKGIEKYFKFVHVSYYTEASLKNVLRLAGFEIIRSHTLPAQLKYSTILSPENFTYSELNIAARRPGQPMIQRQIEKENWQDLARIVRQAWQRDWKYFQAWRLLGRLRRLPFLRAVFHRRPLKNPLEEYRIA